MTPQEPALDIVTVAIAIAALMFSHEVSEFVGPYAVILTGAVFGAALSGSRRPPATRIGTATHMVFFTVAGLIATVPCANLAAQYLPSQVGARVLLPFVAAAISGIGQDWAIVFRWAVKLGRGFIERKVSAQSPGDEP